jgi:hypothetical protein
MVQKIPNSARREQPSSTNKSGMSDPRPAKQGAIEAIERLPDDVALEEIVYRLHLLNKVRQGLKDIDEGHVTSNYDLEREIEQW